MPKSETTGDQAAGLRRMADTRPVRVIAVTGGKGGVGKTNVSVNLAMSLAAGGNRVMLLDADLGLANVDILLGINPTHNLSHVLSGDRTLEEIVVKGPGDIRIVPAASGIAAMAELSRAEHAGLIQAFSEIGRSTDVLIVDTAAGISDNVIAFTRASQEVVVVVCDEPASITDAYALIKVLSRDHGQDRFHVLANMARSNQEGKDLYTKLARVTLRYLDVTLEFMGSVPFDEYLRKAVQRQRAVVEAFPRSPAATAFRNLARKAEAWPPPRAARGHLEFFVEQLIQADAGLGAYM